MLHGLGNLIQSLGEHVPIILSSFYAHRRHGQIDGSHNTSVIELRHAKYKFTFITRPACVHMCVEGRGQDPQMENFLAAVSWEG